MATQPSPPPIGIQYEEILEFTVNQCYKFDKVCEKSENYGIRLQGPPKCERSTTPVKTRIRSDFPVETDSEYFITDYEKLPLAEYHKDSWGHININTRECPHCNTVIYGQHKPVSIQTCLHCNCRFLW